MQLAIDANRRRAVGPKIGVYPETKLAYAKVGRMLTAGGNLNDESMRTLLAKK